MAPVSIQHSQQFGAGWGDVAVGVDVVREGEDVVPVLGEETTLQGELLVAEVVGDEPLGLVDATDAHREPRWSVRDERQLVEPAGCQG